MFLVLERCAALAHLAPELDALFSGPTRAAVFETLARAAAAQAPLAVRFAALAWFASAQGKDGGVRAFRALCDRLRAPVDVRELAVLACRCRDGLRGAQSGDAAVLLGLLKNADAFRRGERFEALLRAAALAEPETIAGATRARAARIAAARVDAGAIARNAGSTGEIAANVDVARLAAIDEAMRRGTPDA